jgi:hypothetical protein
MVPQTEAIQNQARLYMDLAKDLKESFAEIDDETLNDTLEGLSDLPDLIKELVRSSIEDNTLLVALRVRIQAMEARFSRIDARQKRKRELARWSMTTAGLDRLQAPDFSVSLRNSAPHLDIPDEAKLPSIYFIPQPMKLDRAGIVGALKRGETIEGAALVEGAPSIQVRTK